jgi:hypothetical protein
VPAEPLFFPRRPDGSPPIAAALDVLAGALGGPGGPAAPTTLTDFLTALLPAVAAARSAVLCGPDGEQLAAVGPAPAPEDAVLTIALPGGCGSVVFAAPDAFPPGAGDAATEAATACAVALRSLALRARVANLEVALESSRQIAAAVGIVMAQTRCPYEEAFQVLRAASQRTHRKVRELAEEVVFTGALPGPGGA